MRALVIAGLLLLVGLYLSAATIPLRDLALPEVQRVLVLANSNEPESLALARHYCERRAIPLTNIVAVPMPPTETISWAEFTQYIWEPLALALEEGGWIDWVKFAQKDIAGRQVRLTNHHAVAYLVLCRGVPLRISHDEALKDKTVDQALARMPQIQTTQASVDSELALMPQLRPPLNAYVPNPFFANQAPTRADLDAVFRVSRLDGPTQADALKLVDRALEAEARGLIGTAYVDIGGIYPDGDRWFEQVAQLLRGAAFELVEDNAPTTFPAQTVLANPVLYLGWYSWNLDGPFAAPEFRFPPGAIAYHLHSFSALSLRSATQGWTGPLIARGATVTFGNVYEPYLSLTLRPDIFMRALLRGWPVGAAGACAQPGLSWQGIMVGDPLYRPFAVSLEEQLRRLSSYSQQEQAHILARRALQLKKP